MPRKGSILLTQGLDVSKPATYIGEQSSPDVQNFTVDQGLLTKRIGTTVRGGIVGGTDIEIMIGTEFDREGTKYNVRIARDKIERYNAGTELWVDITGSDLTGGTDDLISVAVPMLSGKRILCITNGIDNIRKWTATGNTADLGGSPPKAKYIQEYETYLVCANITGGVDVTQRVQWCDTADPEEWTTGNSGSVDLIEDGEDITGLNIFGNFICVHKRSSIYLGTLVSSNAIFQFDRLGTEVGTVANGSIVNLPTSEQIFLAQDGLRLFNGVTASLIDSPINEEIRDSLNKDNMHKAWGVLVLEKDEVWVGLPIGDQTVGATVYKFNYVTRVLYKDVRADVNACWRATQTTSDTWDDTIGTWNDSTSRWNDGQLGASSQRIHFGKTNGYTEIQNTGAVDDNGTTIDAFWESKDFTGDSLGQLIRWQELLLWAKGSGTLTAEYSTDEGETWTSFTNSPFTLSDVFPLDSSPMKGYMDVVSTKVRVRFRHNNTGSCQIKQFTVAYVEREYI